MEKCKNNTNFPDNTTKVIHRGFPGNVVPKELVSLFPAESFKKPEREAGVYGFYFPTSKKVYIGQSKNVWREILLAKTPSGLSRRHMLKEALYAEGEKECYTFQFNQSKSMEFINNRIAEEKRLVNLAGSMSINVVFRNNASFLDYTTAGPIINPLLKPRTAPWSYYEGKNKKVDLPYPVLPIKSGESCLYVLRHKGSGNFYIGETANSVLTKRMKNHKTNLRRIQYYLNKNESPVQTETYKMMINDMQTSGPEFEYSIIEYLDQLPRNLRVKRENEVIADAIYRYGKRVYNIRTPLVKMLVKKIYLEKNISKMNPRRPYSEMGLEANVRYKQRKYPVIINNVWYNMAVLASRALGIPLATIEYRCKSPRFPDYISLKFLGAKIIPNDVEIIKKYNYYQSLINSQNQS